MSVMNAEAIINWRNSYKSLPVDSGAGPDALYRSQLRVANPGPTLSAHGGVCVRCSRRWELWWGRLLLRLLGVLEERGARKDPLCECGAGSSSV